MLRLRNLNHAFDKKKRLEAVSFLYGKQYTSIKSFILIVDEKEKEGKIYEQRDQIETAVLQGL